MEKSLKISGGLLMITLLVLSIASCDDYFLDSVKGNGNVTTEKRFTYYFNSVNLQGSFDVIVTQDTFNEVIVEAEETLQPYILTGVKGETLIIKSLDNTNLRNTRPMKIWVRSKDLRKVILSGSGSVVTDTFTQNTIDLVLSGSGYIDLAANAKTIDALISGSGEIVLFGSTQKSIFNISGSGDIRSLDMLQDECTVTISGSGSVYTNVRYILDVIISGSGSVNYHGNPVIYQRITGSGSVIKI